METNLSKHTVGARNNIIPNDRKNKNKHKEFQKNHNLKNAG